MIWLFHKGTAELRLETKFDSSVGDYVAVLHHPDGTELTARFSDEETFRGYLLHLELRLSRERWRNDRRPVFLASGWRDAPPA